MKLISEIDHCRPASGPHVLAIANDADPRALNLDGVERIELSFPKFSDGRAFSQAFLLRRRLGFKGEIRATGDVLIDQLVQMQRNGFDAAVLRADQNPDFAQRQFKRFPAFYQGDAVTPKPHFIVAQASPQITFRSYPMNAIKLNAQASADFDAKLAQTTALLQQAARDYAPLAGGVRTRISQASSLGAEDVVISHLINTLQLDIGIFVLQTGRLHAETLELLARFKTASRVPVEVFTPAHEAVVQFVAREGQDAMYQSIALRKACCQIRKMEPLARALTGKDAWITGLRREQSGARAEVPLIDRSDATRVKINPLADWTWGDVWHFIALQGIDYNPLHDRFFPSIGCEPCTRAVSLGEDFRAGRWWWEDEAAKECGLHVRNTSEITVRPEPERSEA